MAGSASNKALRAQAGSRAGSWDEVQLLVLEVVIVWKVVQESLESEHGRADWDQQLMSGKVVVVSGSFGKTVVNMSEDQEAVVLQEQKFEVSEGDTASPPVWKVHNSVESVEEVGDGKVAVTVDVSEVVLAIVVHVETKNSEFTDLNSVQSVLRTFSKMGNKDPNSKGPIEPLNYNMEAQIITKLPVSPVLFFFETEDPPTLGVRSTVLGSLVGTATTEKF